MMNLSMNRWFKVLLIMVFIGGIVLGGVIGVFAKDLPLKAMDNPKEGVTPQVSQNIQPSLPNPGTNSIQDIVEQAGPAVVKIETLTNNSTPYYFNDPFFRNFFGDQFNPSQEPQTRTGMGSGFIISNDGYILTNEHVIADANEIKVNITGIEEPLTAKLVGSDHKLDLAILKVEADKDLPTLKLGDSSQAKVGDSVIAIGNPYGLDHTVTVGVVSAKGRPVTIGDTQYKNLLQTDASINPGNSGGPLINMQGEVIGINTAINAQAQGIGFAIPSNTVTEVLTELKETGKVARPYLGVYMQSLTKELAASLKLGSTDGALVAQVVPGSPAEQAGIQRGDVIIEFDGKPVKTPDDLGNLVKASKIGDKKVLVIAREGTTSYKTLTIGVEK